MSLSRQVLFFYHEIGQMIANLMRELDGSGKKSNVEEIKSTYLRSLATWLVIVEVKLELLNIMIT